MVGTSVNVWYHHGDLVTQTFPSRLPPGTRLKFCWRPAATTKMSYSLGETCERRGNTLGIWTCWPRENSSLVLSYLVKKSGLINLGYKCCFCANQPTWDVCSNNTSSPKSDLLKTNVRMSCSFVPRVGAGLEIIVGGCWLCWKPLFVHN